VIWFDEAIKQRSIKMRRSSGLGLVDFFIAATALVNGFPFLTADKEFQKLSWSGQILHQQLFLSFLQPGPIC